MKNYIGLITSILSFAALIAGYHFGDQVLINIGISMVWIQIALIFVGGFLMFCIFAAVDSGKCDIDDVYETVEAIASKNSMIFKTIRATIIPTTVFYLYLCSAGFTIVFYLFGCLVAHKVRAYSSKRVKQKSPD